MITVVLGMALFAINVRMSSAVVHHEERQAYYTALSSLDTISQWISGSSDSVTRTDEVNGFLASIPGPDSAGVDIPLSDLPDDLGECTVNLRFTDEQHSELLLTATATYADTTETLSLTMYGSADAEALSATYKVAEFDLAAYDTRAGELNTQSAGTPIRVGDTDTTNNSKANADNITALNKVITSTASTSEAWWTHTNSSNNESGHSSVLGTQTLPLIGAGTATDSRRFVTPINGRLLVNPLEEAAHSTDNGHAHMYDLDEDTNTKLNSLAIDTSNSQTGAIQLRLASVNGSTEGRLNALLMLTFTDYEKGADGKPIATTATAGSGSPYTWYPNNWDSLDVYLQSNAGLDTNVLIGPFGHKYAGYMDTYWSWGNYMDDVHGTTKGEFKSQWPYVENQTHFDDYGIPMFPADYDSAGFWVLDGKENRYFRILQGVNIFDGSIYSTRSTIIGGGLIKNHVLGHTTDNVNSGSDGFGEQTSNDYAAVYVEGTLRYGQIIADTDIILKASGAAESVIRRPDTWRDRQYRANNIPAHDKTYEPTMTIKGGTIYVDEWNRLTIEGTVTGVRSGTDSTVVPLDNMWISPDRIVVAPQAQLTIKASATTNVLTDIYVDGGILIIEPGAKIKGNIYCYNGGEVIASGSFRLDSPHEDEWDNELTPVEELDGIHIYGQDLAGVVPGITDSGRLTVVSAAFAEATVISGSSNKVHLFGPFGELVEPTVALSNIEHLLCNDHDSTDGHCQHFDSKSGGWLTGAYEAP
ncbi:MAG: hypothetical protein LBP24_00760 [Coriobacteriales bacterium]|nr:hypothetical protein [Coriobacteriales bacterium]